MARRNTITPSVDPSRNDVAPVIHFLAAKLRIMDRRVKILESGHKEQNDSANGLENYGFQLRSTLSDDKRKEKSKGGDKEEIETAMLVALERPDKNQLVEKNLDMKGRSRRWGKNVNMFKGSGKEASLHDIIQAKVDNEETFVWDSNPDEGIGEILDEKKVLEEHKSVDEIMEHFDTDGDKKTSSADGVSHTDIYTPLVSNWEADSDAEIGGFPTDVQLRQDIYLKFFASVPTAQNHIQQVQPYMHSTLEASANYGSVGDFVFNPAAPIFNPGGWQVDNQNHYDAFADETDSASTTTLDFDFWNELQFTFLRPDLELEYKSLAWIYDNGFSLLGPFVFGARSSWARHSMLERERIIYDAENDFREINEDYPDWTEWSDILDKYLAMVKAKS